MNSKQIILVIDDSEVNRIMFRDILGSYYTIIEAVNGKQAIDILMGRHDEIDMVLLDLIMPEMDGLSVLSEMNTRNLIKKVPVVVITSDQDPEDIEKAFGLGAVDFFVRPCNTTILLNRIKNIISWEKSRKEELRALNALSDIGDDKIGSIIVGVDTESIVDANYLQSDILGLEKLKEYDEFMELISQKAQNNRGREIFLNSLNIDVIKEMFEKEEHFIDTSIAFMIEESRRIVLRIAGRLYQEENTNNRYAELLLYDYTDKYLQNQLPRVLYETDYEFIGLIDTINHKMALRKVSLTNEDSRFDSDNVVDYDLINQNMLHHHVVPADQRKFMLAVTFNNIINQLDMHGIYEFSTYIYNDDREPRLKKFRYTYFDKTTKTILLTAEDITEISEQDIITDGYNRNGFVRVASRIIASSFDDEKFDIIYFDIKGLKAINELFGIKGGDNVIRHMYNTIRTSRLEPLITARSSSDHFLALVRRENVTPEILSEVCSDKYEKDGKSITIYQRCGIFEVEDKSLSISIMTDRAKMAVSHITNEYAKPYEYYKAAMSEKYVDKNEVLGSLSEAIENNEFEAYFQPIYDAKTEKIAAAEALVRWNHPTRGLLSPGVFIPGLEENGHVSQLDLFVEQVTREYIERRVSEGKKVVPISVNLSRMDFYDEEMINSILDDIKNAGVTRDLYRFEITESSYVSLAETNIKALTTIKDLGAKLLIDDFGSGYSSFNAITEYDFDTIKLDMAFVRKIGKNSKIESIIKSLIDMAHNMGAEVVAEGAETREQVDFLRESNCDYIQGYYYSKPVTWEKFVEMLDGE